MRMWIPLISYRRSTNGIRVPTQVVILRASSCKGDNKTEGKQRNIIAFGKQYFTTSQHPNGRKEIV